MIEADLALARAVHAEATADTPAMLDDLRALVEIESPTYELDGCDRAAHWIADRARAVGAVAELVPGQNGLHVHAQLRGAGSARVAFLCHHDTVFPVGTTDGWSFASDADRVTGPGVCDMKGGIVVALRAMEALRSRPAAFGLVELVSVPDEEERDGPPETIDRLVGFDAALCMECGREDGSVVSERKGGIWVRLVAHGRAAHAGTEPDAGRNAVVALASEALRLQALHRARPGLTAQVTRLCGGGSINTVPAEAELVVDVRAVTEADLAWASAEADPHPVDGVTIDRTDIARTPTMERTPAVRALARAACSIGTALGTPTAEATTGGTSDAAWTAGIGIPTIDGLGPIGGRDHTPEEYAEVASFALRTAMNVALVHAIEAGLLAPQHAGN